MIEYPPYGYAKDYGYCHIVAHKCECSGKINAEYRQSRALIPAKYVNKHAFDFDWNVYGCDIQQQKYIVNDFIQNFHEYEASGVGLYIYSKTKGSGKSLLSAIIANTLMEKMSLSVKFIAVVDLLEMVRKNYKAGDYDNDIEAFFKTRLLILDDIGVEMKKEHTDLILYRLINERSNNRLTTIFTSNLPIDDLKLDDRTIDRINEIAAVVDIPNVPVRRNMAAEKKRNFIFRNKKAIE